MTGDKYHAAFEKALAAARSGNAQAQVYLAVAYMTGLGVQKSECKAFEWCRLSAEQGHLRAQILLAYMYERGVGTSADSVRASLWFVRATRDVRDNHEVQEALIRYAGARVVDQDECGTLYHYKSRFGKYAWVAVIQRNGAGAVRKFIAVPPDIESAGKALLRASETEPVSA